MVTTLGGAGVLHGDLTPDCAGAVQAVLEALSASADAQDTRTREQWCHDGLQEAISSAIAAYLRAAIAASLRSSAQIAPTSSSSVTPG